MKLVTLKELVQDGFGKYAVCGINCCNMENIRDILEVAEDTATPVIIQAAPVEIDYFTSAEAVVETVKTIGKNKNIKVAIHLDHGDGYKRAVECIKAGFTGIMFDGSLLSFEENISETKKISELARTAAVTFEAELGTIGSTNELGERIDNSYMTDPDSAKIFVEETKIDVLAVGIGNAHGLYPYPPSLDLGRLRKIVDFTKVPIVLHGGSGIPEEQIKEAIKIGIGKINFSTVTRVAFLKAVNRFITENPDNTMIMDALGAGSVDFKKEVKEVLRLSESIGMLK